MIIKTLNLQFNQRWGGGGTIKNWIGYDHNYISGPFFRWLTKPNLGEVGREETITKTFGYVSSSEIDTTTFTLNLMFVSGLDNVEIFNLYFSVEEHIYNSQTKTGHIVFRCKIYDYITLSGTIIGLTKDGYVVFLYVILCFLNSMLVDNTNNQYNSDSNITKGYLYQNSYSVQTIKIKPDWVYVFNNYYMYELKFGIMYFILDENKTGRFRSEVVDYLGDNEENASADFSITQTSDVVIKTNNIWFKCTYPSSAMIIQNPIKKDIKINIIFCDDFYRFIDASLNSADGVDFKKVGKSISIIMKENSIAAPLNLGEIKEFICVIIIESIEVDGIIYTKTPFKIPGIEKEINWHNFGLGF